MSKITFVKLYSNEKLKDAIEQLGKDEAVQIANETFEDLKRAGFGTQDCKVGALNMVVEQADAKREAS